MANYATHIGVGTVVSGALATLTVGASVIGPESIMAVTLAGVAGSVLPDIDLRDSRASSILFSGIAVFASFCVLFINADRYSIAELWILWLGSMLFVRYGLHTIFHRVAVHRGVWHSLLAGALWAGLTAILFHNVLGLHPGVAWLGGGFMLIGYITHLVLDEIYSVDFMGNRLKASFGSALKLYDPARPSNSLAMAAAVAVVLYAAPSPKPFFEAITAPSLWTGLNDRLLPQEKWFGVFGRDLQNIAGGSEGTPATASQDGASPITTGSIRRSSPSPAEAGTTEKPAQQAE